MDFIDYFDDKLNNFLKSIYYININLSLILIYVRKKA